MTVSSGTNTNENHIHHNSVDAGDVVAGNQNKAGQDLVMGDLINTPLYANTVNIHLHKPGQEKQIIHRSVHELVTPLIEVVGNFTEKGIVILNHQKRIEYINPIFWNQMGLSMDDYIRIKDLFNNFASCCSELAYDLTKAFKPIDHSYKQKAVSSFTLTRKDKSTLANWSVLPVMDSRQMAGVVIIIVFERLIQKR